MTTPPTTPTTLDAAWEALAADIHANGYSVRDAIARHRPLIEAAIWDAARFEAEGTIAQRLSAVYEAALTQAAMTLDVERLARALNLTGHYPLPVNEHIHKWAAAIAREYATTPPPPATPPKPLGFVTLAWDATAEDVARIRRDWEAAAPDPAPLDVERLARAFWSVTRERFAASPLVPDLPEWRDPSIDAATWDKSVSDAAEVAREYAKEPQP